MRPARAEDVAGLPNIERRAAVVFKTYPADLGLSGDSDRVTSVDTFIQALEAGRLWVAESSDAAIVGFALVSVIGEYAHLEELDVLPEFGRRGVGSALLAAVCAWARRSGYPALTLRTFRDVPWNAPFYSRRGFRIVASASVSPAHVELESRERERGLRADLRVTMVIATA